MRAGGLRAETDPRPELKRLLEERFGIPTSSEGSVLFGGGVAPLFTALARTLTGADGTLLVPAGSYGYFVGTSKLLGGRIERVPTEREHSFKLTPARLEQALKKTASETRIGDQSNEGGESSRK